MKYTLEYFDRALQRCESVVIEADTVKKAMIAAEKLLKDKNYINPGLYETEE